MDSRDLLVILQKTGFKTVYAGLDEMYAPPYISYQFLYTSNQFSDNSLDTIFGHWQVNLYTQGKRLDDERTVEAVLNDHGICWEKMSGDFDAKEKVLQTIYEFGEVE